MAQAQVKQTDIITALADLDRGRFMMECARQMTTLTTAVRNTSKKGTLIIRLEINPGGMRDGRVNQVEVRPAVSVVAPKPDVKSTIFFVRESGDLVRDDPEQMDMFDETAEHIER